MNSGVDKRNIIQLFAKQERKEQQKIQDCLLFLLKKQELLIDQNV